MPTEVRKEFPKSERVAIAQAIEAELKAMGERRGRTKTDNGQEELIVEEIVADSPQLEANHGEKSREVAAKKAGFSSTTTYRDAKAVVTKGTPELVEAMDKEAIAVSTAAKLAGLDSLPCWVEDMDDETVFYELIRNNNQGELSPLEIGLHALEYVEAYKEGGIKRYAEGVGYKHNSISHYRQAAMVFKKVADIGHTEESRVADKTTLLSKTNHLYEISNASAPCWPVLVELMLSKGWTVQETREAVNRAREYDIPPKWESLFLPLPAVVYRGLDTAEFSPVTSLRLSPPRSRKRRRCSGRPITCMSSTLYLSDPGGSPR